MPPTPISGERALWDQHFSTAIATAVSQAISANASSQFLSSFYTEQVKLAAQMASDSILARREHIATYNILE